MPALDILTVADASQWVHVDGDDAVVEELIHAAYDAADGSIDDFTAKLKSAKFKRKLRLFMLNYVTSAYDKRGLESECDWRNSKAESGSKMDFINATLLMQLQYGTYSEEDT